MSTVTAVGNHQEAFYSKTAIPRPLIERYEGLRYYTDDGREFIDANAGAVVANIGPANERVLQAMLEQGRKMTFSYVRFTKHEPNIELTRRIAELAGPGFERVHLANDGSEANEMAIKFLRACAYAAGKPAKRKVISLQPGYHGSTLATMGWSGDTEYTALWSDLMVPAVKIPAPLTYRRPEGLSEEEFGFQAARHLETAILEHGPENVLAFIMEPVGGTATGANVAPSSYLREVRRICDQYDVYWVFDEVMSATRTGEFLAAQHNPDALPDAVVIAKGLGAGYVPLGAVAVSAQLVDELTAADGFDLSHTYNANPICCAAGCAVLDEMTERGLIENGRVLGDTLRARLNELAERWPIIGDVRGRGLMLGVELVADRETKLPFTDEASAANRLRAIAMDHGLLIGGRRLNGGVYGEWILTTPALTITVDEIDEITEKLDKTLDVLSGQLVAEGHLRT